MKRDFREHLRADVELPVSPASIYNLRQEIVRLIRQNKRWKTIAAKFAYMVVQANDDSMTDEEKEVAAAHLLAAVIEHEMENERRGL